MKTRLFSIFIVVACLFSAVVGPAAASGASVSRPPALLTAGPTPPPPPAGHPQSAGQRVAAAGVDASALMLGQPGMSFRYAQTFGVTETPYFSDTAHLNFPWGITTDGTNLIVGELWGHRLLKYTNTGAFVSSQGQAGTAYNDSDVQSVFDIAVDDSGQTWVADVDGGQVLQFDASGAYLGRFKDGIFSHPAGIAFDAAGDVYISDGGHFWNDDLNHQFVKIYDDSGNELSTIGITDTVGSDNSHLHGPQHIAVYSDTLYVADGGNSRVQIFDVSAPATPVYSATLGIAGESGNDNAHFDHPSGVAVDLNYIYVADRFNHRVQVFSRLTRAYVTTMGTGYGAGNDQFNNPTDVSLDTAGNIYVADFANCRVQQFNSSRIYQRTYGVTDVPYLTDVYHYNSPAGVAVALDGSLYLTEDNGDRLIKLNAAGVPQWTVGTAGLKGDFFETTNDNLNNPSDVAVDAVGRVYVADRYHGRVQIFNSTGTYAATLGGGTDNYAFSAPTGLTIGPNGYIYVADDWRQRVQIFDAGLNYIATLGETNVSGADNGHFTVPSDVAVDSSGQVYVADTGNNRVQVFNASRAYVRTLGVTGQCSPAFDHFCSPGRLFVDSLDRLYIADNGNSRIQVFDASGAYLTTIGGEWSWGSRPGQFRSPLGLAIDQGGNLYVADHDNHRIQKFALGVPGWQQANLNGFGNRYNRGVTAMEVFSGTLYAGTYDYDEGASVWRMSGANAWTRVSEPGLGSAYTLTNRAIIDMVAFNNQLYAGTGWGNGGGQLWRSPDGTTWNQVWGDVFGDANNSYVAAMAAYSGVLYVGTGNGNTGAQIWRSSSGDALSWTNVVTAGLSCGADCRDVTGLTVFNGNLYAAVEAHNNPSVAIQIWRTSNGTAWSQVGAADFTSADNYQTGGFATLGGNLYVGTKNDVTGAQVWRSSDGSAWTQVVGDGFGDLNNYKVDGLYAVGSYLYAATDNDATGTEIWRSADGTHWSQVSPDGFGDGNNTGSLWSSAGVVFNQSLFLGTWNWNGNGGEIWQYMGYPVYLPRIIKH